MFVNWGSDGDVCYRGCHWHFWFRLDPVWVLTFEVADFRCSRRTNHVAERPSSFRRYDIASNWAVPAIRCSVSTNISMLIHRIFVRRMVFIILIYTSRSWALWLFKVYGRRRRCLVFEVADVFSSSHVAERRPSKWEYHIASNWAIPPFWISTDITMIFLASNARIVILILAAVSKTNWFSSLY